jgi:putative sterol carrier protein
VAATSNESEAFFQELGRRGHEASLEQANGTIRFDLVAGSRTDHWFVTLKKGEVSASRRNVKADCVVRTKRAVFDAIVRGDVNEMAAYLRGELALEGDPELLVVFRRVFPAPRRARRRQVARKKRE